MSAQPFEQAVSVARGVLAGVSADQLDAATPCESWDVAALINHILGGQHFFLASLNSTPPAEPPDVAAGDFVAAFDEVSSACITAFRADGVLEQTIHAPVRRDVRRRADGAGDDRHVPARLGSREGNGSEHRPRAELASALLAQSQASISEAFRGPEGAPFGAEQAAPAGATAADQLAAFLGRAV